MNTRLHRVIRIIGVIGAALIAVGIALPFAAQPKITWSSPDVYAGITSTTTVQQTLTFTSDQAMQNVRLEAVPEIARFVNIQPATFTVVPKGQPQTVRLTFSAPAGAQFGTFEGTIHLRDGNATRPQTIKTSVTYAVVPLPPDPGEVGKATLQGIDSDSDGVRDDIERYIALTPNSAKARAALMQMARAGQLVVLQSSDKSSSRQNLKAVINGRRCAQYMIDLNTSIKLMNDLQAHLLNTLPRSQAWIQADKQASGDVIPIVVSASGLRNGCSFNPDVLEN